MLSRASAKEREFAVRAALGASQFALIRSFLTESLLLTVSGGSLGLLLAWWGVMRSRVWAAGRIPLIDRLELDGSVMLFTVLLCVVTMIVFAIAPAVNDRERRKVIISSQGGGHSHTSPPRLLRICATARDQPGRGDAHPLDRGGARFQQLLSIDVHRDRL
jgi:hypothetical protein